MDTRQKLLIIGFVWPEPNSSAAGVRMMQLIEAFQNTHYQVTFVSAALHTSHAIDLGDLGIHVDHIKLNDDSFNAFIADLQPDIVMFDRFMTEEQFGWRVAEQCPDALRILDTEDLHSLRKVRQECYRSNQEFTISKWLEADITKREIASIYRCDLSLVISSYEMLLLKNTLKIKEELLHYLPFMLDDVSESEIEKLPKFNDRQNFVTIGNFRHEPNYDSVRYLKESIWPKVRHELPDAEMHVYGSYPSQKVTQLQNEKEKFFIKGWTDNVDDVMKKYRVCLAPLRFGAGIKGKFMDAMKNGTPSVTTSIGGEGFTDNFGGVIVDGPAQICDKAVELYVNEEQWKINQDKGFQQIKELDKHHHQKQLIEKVVEIKKLLNELRTKNFIGAMLQHQTILASKYMSKWIQEKNKR